MTFVNISSYKFIDLPSQFLGDLRDEIRSQASLCDLKGTVLLSPEGINMFLAGTAENMKTFTSFLRTKPEFSDMSFKESFSDTKPFSRMLVKLKKEIISLRQPEVRPSDKTAPYISAAELDELYESGEDFIILDTRNTYETRLVKFKDAIDPHIQSFTDFIEKLDEYEDIKKKKIVTYCTGGIRCEKAGELMLQKGFENVCQLDGGILKYFEETQAQNYDGECFVFDKRVALDKELNETKTVQCFSCRNPLDDKELNAPSCPYCGDETHNRG